MAKGYVVTGFAVAVTLGGTNGLRYLYKGDRVPNGVDEGHLEALAGMGMVKEVDLPELDEDNGYEEAVGGSKVEFPDGAPVDAPEWTVKALKAYAAANSVDLGSATKRDDLLQVLVVPGKPADE